MKNKLRVIHQAGTEDRAEISPVLRLIVDADQIHAISAEYRRIAAGDGETGRASAANVSGSDDAGSDQVELEEENE
jgi:hypothetical protein